jgi:aspartate aminotransferase, mitochondrial
LLGVGAYRDDKGKPYILECVKKAEYRMLEKNMDHEYAGIQGIDSYIGKCLELGYGKDSKQLKEGRIAGC